MSSNSIGSILKAFDALSIEQKKQLIEALRRRTNADALIGCEAIQEIEVLGGYDVTYDDQSTKLPLPAEVTATVRNLTSRAQLGAYLKQLRDDEILWKYRFLQYRYLPDGTLWQIFAHAHIHRGTPSASRLGETELSPLASPENERLN